MPVRHTVFQESVSLLLSIPGHSSAPSIPHESGCLGRFHAAPSALPPSSPGRPESGWLGRYTTPPPPLLLPRPHTAPPAPAIHQTSGFQTFSVLLQTTWLLPFFSPPWFECLAWNFLPDFISSPSFGVLVSTISAIFPLFFTCFWLPSLVRAKVPRNADHAEWASAPCHSHRHCIPTCQEPLKVFAVTYTIQFALRCSPLFFRKARLLPCRCYAMYLKHCDIHSPPSPSQGLWGLFSYFQGTYALHPITRGPADHPDTCGALGKQKNCAETSLPLRLDKH